MFEDKQPDRAIEMAQMIEKWLGNPVSKKMLRFCTKHDKCGRRIELILKDYAGEKQNLCLGCKTSKFIVSKLLDKFIQKADINRDETLRNLRDPMWRKGLSSVLEGIAKYGPTKPFTSFSPFLIVWNITRACNLNCKHCYENAHTASADELSKQEKLEAVDKMADAGVAYIAISGGEPLTLPELWDIAKHIKSREIAFSIATNGTLLTQENVKKLEDAECKYVQISLDGATPETHDWLRGKGAFEKAVQGIKNAVKSHMTIGIACTVTKRNLEEIPQMLDLADKLGVDIFMHYNFIPTGRGKDIIDLDITPEQREDLLQYLAKETKKRKYSILSSAPQYARVCAGLTGTAASLTHFDTISQKDFGDDVKFLAEFVGGCGTARLYCALEPNGDIEPCVFIPIKVGNIKTDELINVWQNNPTMIALRKRGEFKKHCNVCKNRNICGGCRARAYGYYKDVQGCDPGCVNNIEEWEKIVSEST